MNKNLKGTPSGFRDLLPSEAQLKEYVVQKISSVYKRYGFMPIETSIVEFAETLTSEVTDFNLFLVSPSKSREKGQAELLAMRFDQTVPLARFVAQNQQIPKPFKRYVFGPVFRGERPQAGRYRQFDQFDADIVGSDNIASDIEVILMMNDVIKEIGIENFVIKVNNRKLLNALPTLFNFAEDKLKSVLIALDKKDKITEDNLIKILIDEGLDEITSQKVLLFGSISGKPSDVIGRLRDIFKDESVVNPGLEELAIIAEALGVLGVTSVKFDMSIIRGLGYYTGTIFETNLLDAPEFGSVYSGGRYDNLVEDFGVPQQPAVGASVGVDRLIAALQKINFKIKDREKTCIIIIQDKNALSYAFTVAKKIRELGLICEVYTGSKKKVGDQLSYAGQREYSYACVIGMSEKETNTLTIKNLQTKEQKVFDLNSLTF